jgi:hypothetical protein
MSVQMYDDAARAIVMIVLAAWNDLPAWRRFWKFVQVLICCGSFLAGCDF